MINKWSIYIILVFFLNSCDGSGGKKRLENQHQVHFSADGNWVGLPSGFVFFNDNYHLFYECNPDEPFEGKSSWGHAISRDLVNWQKLPLAIVPDKRGSINAGSVVADTRNTSGLGSLQHPPLIAFYTYGNPKKERTEMARERGVYLAFSLDQGRSWTKKSEPVLTTNEWPVFRCPNVKWNELLQEWLMTISVGPAIQFYSSPDCLNWSFLCDFGGSVENLGSCEHSDFFPLYAEGSGIQKWILLVSTSSGPAGDAPAVRYFVGDFSAFEFRVTQHQELWVDYGRDNHGAMTCNNSPDDRKLMIGWMNCRLYADQIPETEGWGSMTIPRELRLFEEGDHCLLSSSPAAELEKRYRQEHVIGKTAFQDISEVLAEYPFPETPFFLRLRFDNSNRYAIWGPHAYGVKLRTKSGNTLTIGYNREMKYFYIDRSGLVGIPFSQEFERTMGAGYAVTDSVSDWNILVGRHSVELFACGNKVAMTSLYYAGERFSSAELFSDSGTTTLTEAAVGGLTGAEKKP